jgi:hypothetical protein
METSSKCRSPTAVPREGWVDPRDSLDVFGDDSLRTLVLQARSLVVMLTTLVVVVIVVVVIVIVV